MLRTSRGVVLLETLVALAILSSAGLALIGLVTEGLRAERDAGAREHVGAVEERVIAAVTLLTREDLDRRIGQHLIGEILVDVQRPERALYRISVRQREFPQVEDLVTIVYRPGADRGS